VHQKRSFWPHTAAGMSERGATIRAESAPTTSLRDLDLRGRGQVLPFTILAALGVGAIWLVDISTGPEYGFAIFYLIPIGLTSWWLGRYAAVFIALLSTVAWILADLAARPGVPVPASLWNGLTRAAIFLLLALLIDQVRRERTALRTVDAHREESLALIAHTLRRSAAEIQVAIPDLGNAPALSAAERDAVLELRRQSRRKPIVAPLDAVHRAGTGLIAAGKLVDQREQRQLFGSGLGRRRSRAAAHRDRASDEQRAALLASWFGRPRDRQRSWRFRAREREGPGHRAREIASAEGLQEVRSDRYAAEPRPDRRRAWSLRLAADR